MPRLILTATNTNPAGQSDNWLTFIILLALLVLSTLVWASRRHWLSRLDPGSRITRLERWWAKIQARWAGKRTGASQPGEPESLPVKELVPPPHRLQTLAEIALIVAWALFAGRQYLNFAPDTWLSGSDYPLQILDYYIWRLLPQCGACVFWNGWVSGGWPAFGEFFGGHLHPLVIVTTLILGPLSASKVVVVASMALAGIAQWWLARVMRLGMVARLWVAMLAVVGGHLSGRMDMGLIIMVLSIASTSLILAPMLELGITGRRRPAIWLGLLTGLALISGQGYMQLGMVFGLLPAYLILLWGAPLRRWSTRLNLLIAGGLALLVSAVNYLPLLRFWNNINKPGDIYFTGAQPIHFIPVNMLISDYAFFTTDALQKKPFPAFYMNYIGWIPVLLAVLTVFLVPRRARRVWFFFIGAIFFIYLASSGVLFRMLVGDLTFLSGSRHPALISPLSVPLVLGLGAWGLDLLVKRFNLPRLGRSLLRAAQPTQVMLSLLIVALSFSIYTVYTFSQRWKVVPIPTERLEAVQAIDKFFSSGSELPQGSTQWVQYPFGDLPMAAAVVEAGYKVNIDGNHRNAAWSERSLPPAYLSLEPGAALADTPGLIKIVGEYVSLVAQPANSYAQVVQEAASVPCRAQAMGGDIEVTCSSDTQGQLIVYENMYPGWQAWRDGTPVDLLSNDWLVVDAPPGEHVYNFRYRPWDASVGLILTVLGLGLAAGLTLLPDTGRADRLMEVFSPPDHAEAPPINEEPPEAEPTAEPGQPDTPAATVTQPAAPAEPAPVHVAIELELPAGAEAFIEITSLPDGQTTVVHSKHEPT